MGRHRIIIDVEVLDAECLAKHIESKVHITDTPDEWYKHHREEDPVSTDLIHLLNDYPGCIEVWEVTAGPINERGEMI